MDQSPATSPETVSGRASPWSNWFTAPKTVLLIAILLFLQYPEVFLGTHSFFNNDLGLFTYPTVHYLRASILRGEIPLWNPLNDCGVPFLAQWNTSVCYPPTWLCVLLPLPWSLNMLCLGHLLLAGAGMYLLAHRWTGDRFASSFAAVAFALNGFTFNCLMWISNMGALGWMPWTILFVERAWREGGRAILWAALIGTLQMLSGAPEIILMTWAILAALWLGHILTRSVPAKASTSRLAVTVLLISGLCAIQLLPFLELVRHSDRQAGASTGAWAMPSWGLANFLVPLFRCSRSILGPYFQIDQQWTTSYYCGVIILALALTATFVQRKPWVWFLTTVAALGVAFALGDHFFLYPLIKKIFPPFGFVRYPIKFLTLTVFALPLLAASALTLRCDSRVRGRKVLVLIAGVLLLLIVFIALCSRLFPYREEVWSATVRNAAGRAAFLVIGMGLLIWSQRLIKISLRRLPGLAVLVLLGVDAITHVPRQNPTVSVRAFDRLDPGTSKVPVLGKSRAMVSRGMQALLSQAAFPDPMVYYGGQRRSLFEDCNLIEGIPKINGFFSLHLKEQSALNALIYEPSNSPNGLVDFLGVTQISSGTEFWKWIPRDSALPLVTAGQQPHFADRQTILTNLAAPGFDARAVVYLSPEAQPGLTDVHPTAARVEVLKFASHNIEFKTESEGPALVVISQCFYPAWKASIEDVPTKIFRANHGFQALRVPSGQHRVSLVYRDAYFRSGALISCVTLAASLAAWFWLLNDPRASPRKAE